MFEAFHIKKILRNQ